jgi:uncharacterized membrane protein
MKKVLYSIFIIFLSFQSLGLTVTHRALDKSSSKESEERAGLKSALTQTSRESELNTEDSYCLAEVIKIIGDRKEDLPGGNKQRTQDVVLKILTGKDKGKERAATNEIPDNPAFSIIGKVGEVYLVNKTENLETGNEDYFLIDYHRENVIWVLGIAFFLLLIIIGGWEGFRTIISLACTISIIAFILIPSIEKGVNPLLGAVVASCLATVLTMLLVAGINIKSLASTLGTVIGVTVSGLIATIVIDKAPLSGLSSTEAMILWGNQFYEINFKGLLAAGMIVSCLGAVMDVAISISSSIYEIKVANPNYSLKELYHSGMNVGKDIMGTMTSTLVLAYTGMALPLLLLISHDRNPVKYLNLELVVSEITATMAGTIGLIISVPATALIMSLLISKKKLKPL